MEAKEGDTLSCQPVQIIPELGLVETCLEKFRYLALRRINSLSFFKKRNAIVLLKDSSKF